MTFGEEEEEEEKDTGTEGEKVDEEEGKDDAVMVKNDEEKDCRNQYLFCTILLYRTTLRPPPRSSTVFVVENNFTSLELRKRNEDRIGNGDIILLMQWLGIRERCGEGKRYIMVRYFGINILLGLIRIILIQ